MRSLLFIVTCFISQGYCVAQAYDTIEVGLTNTVHLVFKSPVLEYDLGSGARIEVVNGQEQQVSDVLISKVGDRLKLAASVSNFETTNLFVETETAYFNFILRYSEHPKKMSYYLSDEKSDQIKGPGQAQRKSSEKEDQELNKAKDNKIIELTLKDLAAKVSDASNQNMEIGESTQRMKYWLNGVFVKGDYIFFRVNMVNEGNVKFDLGYEGFFIKDKPNKGLKKSTKQIPEPIDKLFIFNDEIKVIEKRQEIKKVYVFRKFTLEPKKVFTIEFWEEQGQRKVELNIPPNKLLEAKTF